jgi:hypothetical protein
MQCAACKGSGIAPGAVTIYCSSCRGTGHLPDDRINEPKCPPCQGTGIAPGAQTIICKVCDGWVRLPPDPKRGGTAVGPLAWFVEAGKPRTAHVQLSALFSSLTGTLRVCDPYYGTGSLFRLDLLTRCSPILFLTSTPDSKEQAFLTRSLNEFRQQHPSTEFRIYGGKGLHDRYLLTDEEIILLGHGLKDVGRSDSFVVKLSRDLAQDMIQEVKHSFDTKWVGATPVI